MPGVQTKSIGEMETESFLTAISPITTGMVTADTTVGIHTTEADTATTEGLVPTADGKHASEKSASKQHHWRFFI